MTDKTETPAAPAADEDERAKAWAEFEDSGDQGERTADDQPPSDDEAGDGGADTDPTNQDDEAASGGSGDHEPPAAAAGEDQEPDWSQAPEPLRKAFEKMKADMEAERKRHGGRVSAMERQLRQLQSQQPDQQPRRDAPPQQGTDGEGAEDPRAARQRQLQQVREDYPEMTEPVIEEIADLRSQLERLSTSVSERQEAEQTAIMQANEAAVLEKHADFNDLMAERGADFLGWIETDAPAWAVKAYEANLQGFVDPAGAIRTLDAFKTHLGLASNPSDTPAPGGRAPNSPDPRRQRQLAAGKAPRTSGPSVSSGIPANGDREQIWESFDRMEGTG